MIYEYCGCFWFILFFIYFFFFFQAEDGIRDTSVTGVQTCALPISAQLGRRGPGVRRAVASLGRLADQERGSAPAHASQGDPVDREVPARVPGQGPALPASAVPPRRR